jgi:hypothetical protein
MATRNRDINKRMNWFDRQFLRAQDFMDEQDYHLDRHRRHNQWMHTAGVVEGLAVSGTAGTNTVTIAVGTALDNLGREIVVRVPVLLTPLPTGAALVEIYLRYSENESDPSTDPGVTGNTRINEPPLLQTRRVGIDAVPANGVLLAVAAVISANGQLAGAPPNPDNSVRTHAAAVVDNDITVNSLSLKRPGDSAGQRPRLSCSAANELRLDNTQDILFADNGEIRSLDTNHRLVFNRASNRMELHEFGDILFLTGNTPTEKMRLLSNGNLGIGGAAPARRLHVLDPGIFSARFETTSTDAAVVEFKSNAATWEYAVSGSVGAFGGTMPAGSLYIHRQGAPAPRLTINPSGNVGIGTNTPVAKLHVQGGASGVSVLSGSNSAGQFTSIQIGRATVDGSLGVASATGDWSPSANAGDITLRTETTGTKLILNNSPAGGPGLVLSNNNVGIGTAAPLAKLQVSGGAIMPSVGNTNTSGIQFPSDPGGGSGDEAFIRYFAVTGETTKLMIGINNDPDDSIGLLQAGTERMTIFNGNVGIGTTTPLYKLHVVNSGGFGGENANGTSLAGNVPIIAQSNSTAIGIINGSGRQAFALNIDGDLGTSTARGVPTFFDKFDGNWNPALALKLGCVGIGTANPASGQRLHVVGNVRIQGNLTVTGAKSGYVADKFINNLGETLEEGDVVCIGDSQATGRYGVNDRIPIPEVDLAQRANDTRVCGIVCQVSTYEGLGTEDVDSSAGKKGADGTKKLSAKLSKAGSKAKATATRPGKTSANEPEATDITKVGPGQMGLMVILGAFAHCKVDADIAPIKVGDLLTTSPTKGHAQKVKDPAQAIGAIVGKALGALKKGKGTIPVIVTLQ